MSVTITLVFISTGKPEDEHNNVNLKIRYELRPLVFNQINGKPHSVSGEHLFQTECYEVVRLRENETIHFQSFQWH